MAEFRARQTRFLVAGLIAAVVAGSVSAGRIVAAAEVPSFRISNLEGQRFVSSTHRGPVVVSFFFTTCVPCIKEIPELHALVTKKYPQTALLFIDPLAEDSIQAIEAFAQRLQVPTKYFYADPLGRLAKKFFSGEFAFPTIVGMKDGSLLFRASGLSPESLAKIEAALK